MKPTIGRIVHYKIPDQSQFLHNGMKSGDVLPAIVVRVWNEMGPHSDLVNLQVFTDCGPVVSATSVHEGFEIGQWSWPTKQS